MAKFSCIVPALSRMRKFLGNYHEHLIILFLINVVTTYIFWSQEGESERESHGFFGSGGTINNRLCDIHQRRHGACTGLLIGLAIDFISGDAYYLDPELVSSELQAVSASMTDNNGLQVVILDITDLPGDVVDKIKAESKVAKGE